MVPSRGGVWAGLRSLSFNGVEAVLVVAAPFSAVGGIAVSTVATDAASLTVRWLSIAVAVPLLLEPAALAGVLLAHSVSSYRRGSNAGQLVPVTAIGWLRAIWRSLETVVAVGYFFVLILAFFGVWLSFTTDVDPETAAAPIVAGILMAVTATIVLVTVVSVRLVATGLYRIAQ